MKNKISQVAVMTIEEGEEILAGQTTVHIPQVGMYKLLAKKKLDGTIDWAHFVQRESGLKEKVIRGTVRTHEEFEIVIEAINNNLRRIFGVDMHPAAYDVYALDGEKVSDTIH